ncbi:small GTP-binding protein, putative [Trichomonas vaginalis G3]|uniref:Small GTP-binding protein, putative n=1 Tax=Trichomonas vaginalis (strain ATCC PRA-98 / G3) TaxID=412133 RepID=A2FBE2_TRIV3|nr:GTPase protein [Trichomonas vaginalis G3]EAX97776.1 small GTP-binding protein, putative [Trichomonas vaginalis G3]KAI5499031.1 GTPase protein [Trichomonas vaginalis G3]|eukprot:XP_001310706.1 small GTP-binding protein [Trichomonas vaginalis G3]
MTIENDDSALSCKIVIIGNSGVGETSLSSRWIKGEYNEVIESTIGANHMSKRISTDGQDLNILIWDTAGQERFKSLAPMYTRSSSAVVLVVSTTDMDSFFAIDYWMDVISESNSVVPPFILAVNKNDLNPPSSEMEDYIESMKSRFESIFFVSAASGEEVDNLFVSTAKSAYNFIVQHAKIRIPTNIAASNKTKSCC